jgi:hypothetical protein
LKLLEGAHIGVIFAKRLTFSELVQDIEISIRSVMLLNL